MAQYRDKRLLQTIALVLKELRTNAEVTQADVYNDINIHVGRIETAKSNPRISTLSALCKYFKISLSDFLKKVENI